MWQCLSDCVLSILGNLAASELFANHPTDARSNAAEKNPGFHCAASFLLAQQIAPLWS